VRLKTSQVVDIAVHYYKEGRDLERERIIELLRKWYVHNVPLGPQRELEIIIDQITNPVHDQYDNA